MNEQEIKQMIERIAALESKNAALEGKFNSLEKQVETINNFLSAITESQSIETAMNEIESVAKQLTECDSATFYCYDNSGDKFFSHGDYRNWQDTQSAEELKRVFAEQKIQNKEKKAVIPLVTSKGKSMGVIVAEKENGFKKSDLDAFKKGSQMISTVELALKKEYEHQGRITDELTNLKNRQGLNEYLENTLCGNLNAGKPVSIIMCDIDHFKQVNDTYGHEAGDLILKNVSAILNEGTRDGADSAFRMGGEEMVCILNCSPEKAIDIAERLREQIEKTPHRVSRNGRDENINVTVSMGVCDIRPNVNIEITPENIREVFDEDLSRADKAAYRAKNSGRNQVVAYDSRIYKSYLAEKAAEILSGGITENIPEIKRSITECLESKNPNTFYGVIYALRDAAASNPFIAGTAESISEKLCKSYGYDSPDTVVIDEPFADTVQETENKSAKAEEQSNVKYYNKEEYSKIDNKFYLYVTAAAAYKIAQKAQEAGVQFSVKYNGDKSVVTLNGAKDKAFIDEMKRQFVPEKKEQKAYNTAPYETPNFEPQYEEMPYEPPQFPKSPYEQPQYSQQPTYQPQKQAQSYQAEHSEKKAPTYFNKDEYSQIQNKTFIGTDSKTAYEISKFAQKNGVQVSAKYDGKNSAVTVDGKKNKDFIETVKRISEWADKVQIKAAKSKEQYQNRGRNTNRGR